MKTITIYELLGMIKDDNAPEDIKTCDYFWEWNKNKRDYIKLGEEELSLFKDYLKNVIVNSLTDEVEIIEEDKQIKKITLNDNGTLGFPKGCWLARNMDKAFAIKINELIDAVNEMKEGK